MEVTWPDGKMVSRGVASEEMNSVLEIPYPRDADQLQDPAPLEVSGVSGPHSQKSRPHPQSHGLKLDSQEFADFAPRMVEVLAKSRLHNDSSTCSLGGAL